MRAPFEHLPSAALFAASMRREGPCLRLLPKTEVCPVALSPLASSRSREVATLPLTKRAAQRGQAPPISDRLAAYATQLLSGVISFL
jgi:hypothetical protein